MSIDIEVGIFLDRAEDEDDSYGFYAHYEEEFAAINAFLRSIGQPEHHEPLELPNEKNVHLRTGFHRTGTSELFPFKDVAWSLESHSSNWRFPQLDLIGESTIYLPRLFEGVLESSPYAGRNVRGFGSTYRLYEECRLLAKVLGIYDDLEDDTNIYGMADFSRDPLVLLLERELDLEKKEREIPLEQMRNLVLQWYPALAENPWSVRGSGACMSLYEATKFSVKHNAALVIH
ncbi:MAG TPA: hypothetical protein VFN35_04835 [Ktedonobacteraceae bacterium]|nr:hypothetical protein [Ktedonobacteraceae bacterium]